MTHQEIIDELNPDLEKSVNEFKKELMKIRAGSLSPASVEDIIVDCFGSMLPIKQLGAISSPSARELLVQLWDQSYVEGVSKAIESSGMGLSVRIDGVNMYFSAPPLTAESRESLIQVLNKKKEEAFQVIRKMREKAWRNIQDGFTAGEIREDDKFKGRDKLDEIVREKRDKIEEMVANKTIEIKG